MKMKEDTEIKLAVMDLAVKALGKVYDDFIMPTDYTHVLEILYKELFRILEGR